MAYTLVARQQKTVGKAGTTKRRSMTAQPRRSREIQPQVRRPTRGLLFVLCQIGIRLPAYVLAVRKPTLCMTVPDGIQTCPPTPQSSGLPPAWIWAPATARTPAARSSAPLARPLCPRPAEAADSCRALSGSHGCRFSLSTGPTREGVEEVPPRAFAGARNTGNLFAAPHPGSVGPQDFMTKKAFVAHSRQIYVAGHILMAFQVAVAPVHTYSSAVLTHIAIEPRSAIQYMCRLA